MKRNIETLELFEVSIKNLINYYKKYFDGLTYEEKRLKCLYLISELKKNNSILESINLTDELRKKVYELFAIKTDTDIRFLLGTIAIDLASEQSLKKDAIYYCCTLNICDSYRNLYKDTLACYNKILEIYSNLPKYLELSSPLEISHLFSFMLWNGYFSLIKKHNYSHDSRMFIPSMSFLDVFKGGGVCLGYSELLSDYLNACNYNASVLIGMYNPINKSFFPSNIICHTLKDVCNNYRIRNILFLENNHANVLISFEDKLFIYDPTNELVLNVLNKSEAEVIGNYGAFLLDFFESCFINPYLDSNFLKRELLRNDIKKAFNRKEIENSVKVTKKIIKKNIDLLEDVYQDVSPYLKLIDEQIDNVNKRVRLKGWH